MRTASREFKQKSTRNASHRYFKYVNLQLCISCAVSGPAAAEWAKPSRSAAALRSKGVTRVWNNVHAYLRICFALTPFAHMEYA